MEQPKLKIGIMAETEIKFRFRHTFISNTNGKSFIGDQSIQFNEGKLLLNGNEVPEKELLFEPEDKGNGAFELFDVTIGVQFHWERKENQLFKGSLQFLIDDGKILVINILPLEDYLISVISSEMSATSSMELLKAHAITSRSWLIAQVVKGKELRQAREKYQTIFDTEEEYLSLIHI